MENLGDFIAKEFYSRFNIPNLYSLKSFVSRIPPISDFASNLASTATTATTMTTETASDHSPEFKETSTMDTAFETEDEGSDTDEVLHPKLRELQYLYQLYEIQQQHLLLMKDYAIPCLLPPSILVQQQEELQNNLLRQQREQIEYQEYLKMQQELQQKEWDLKMQRLQEQIRLKPPMSEFHTLPKFGQTFYPFDKK